MKSLIWLFVAIIAGLFICSPVIDADLWWHITVGRWIVAHYEVPHIDYWNLFGAGKSWRAYSWSNEVILALVDTHFGDHGLLTLQLILSSLLGLSLSYVFSKLSNNWFFGLLLGVFTTAALSDHFTLRPQSVTWIFFIWLIYVLDKIEREGFTPGKLVAVVGVLSCWANSHITTIFGLATIALWSFSSLRRKETLLLIVVGFFGTLLTPYFGAEWITFFSKADHALSYRIIAEFKPAVITDYVTGFLVLAATVLALLWMHLGQSSRQVHLGKLLLVAGFSLAGLAVVKFMPFALLSAASLIALVWRHFETVESAEHNLQIAVKKLQAASEICIGQGGAFVLVCYMLYLVYPLWQQPIDSGAIPKNAFDFIEKKSLPDPLLHGFGEGGYVMYRKSTSEGELSARVPIDGRTNVVPRQIWEAFEAAAYGAEGWDHFITVTQPETILWRSDSPFASLLMERAKWCRVYRDRDSGPTKVAPSSARQSRPVTSVISYSVFVKKEIYDAAPENFPHTVCSKTTEI